MKAILINPEMQTISEIQIQIDNSLESMYKVMDCEMIEAPVTFDNEDTLYCDEEGLFKPQKGGIIAKDWAIPILGKVLILGSDDEGNSADVRGSIETYKDMFAWVDEAAAERHRSRYN